MPHYFDAIEKAAFLSDLMLDCATYSEGQALQRKFFKLAKIMFAGTSICFIWWREWIVELKEARVKEELSVDSSSNSSSWIKVDEGLEADDSGSDVTVFSDVDLVQFGVNCAIVTASSRDAGFIV